MSKTIPRGPIFIVGSVHTGTTLVSKILSRHPDVFGGLGETCFFHNYSIIVDHFPQIDDKEEQSRLALYLIKLVLFGYNNADVKHSQEDFERLCTHGVRRAELRQIVDIVRCIPSPTYEDIFRIVNEQLAAIHGKNRWREKTPGHLYYIERIINHYPAACFIELVRDPRDVLASKQKRRQMDASLEELDSGRKVKAGVRKYDPLLDSVAWKGAVKAGNRGKMNYPEKILRIRYEDFVQNPAALTSKLCHFAGLSISEPILRKMLDVEWINTTVTGQHGTQGIGTDSVEKWKIRLSSAEVAICQQLVKKEMTELGYERAILPRSALLTLPIQVAKSAVEIVKQLVGYRHTQNTGHARAKLQNLRHRVMGVIGLEM